jgi:hypothetical protein
MAVVDNTRETITEVHHSFAVLFSRLFSRHPSNPNWEPQKGQANGTVSNRDLLWDGSLLSEVGSALASRVLDRTSRARVSAQAGATGIAALFRPEDARFTKSTRRNNRSARVLAASKLVTVPPAKGHNRRRMAALVNAARFYFLPELRSSRWCRYDGLL